MAIDRPGGPYAEEMTAPPAWPEVNEDTLRDGADEFRADHQAVDEQLWAFQRGQVTIFQGVDAWSGDAADAAYAKHQQQITTLQSQAQGSAASAKLYSDSVGVVVSAKQQIIANVENAQKMIAQVANDSQATSEQKDYFIKGLVKATHAENAEIVTAAAAKLGAPTDAPLNVRPASNGRELPLAPPKPPEEIGPQIPKAGTNPEDVDRWWNSLSDEQRRLLIDQHPPELGNLNGIPVEARSQVNIAVMNHDMAVINDAAQRAGVLPNDVIANPAKYGLSSIDVLRYQNAVKTNAGLIHDAGKNGSYPTYLFAYDPTAFGGKGRAAICIGNPDKAANTSVIVPGTNSSVAGGWLADGHNDALNLYERANAADPAHPTAVMAWMGYDPPVADLNHWDKAFRDPQSLSQVGTPWMARQGGEVLAQDVNGLWVTHDGGVPQHVTVLGHSYGSTTVADAFANSGMHANDAVLLGCPGTDLARNAADFHLDGGHVYVGDASTDPISWIGESGHLPSWVNDALGHPVGSLAGLGTDPASDQFGSIRFRAEVPGSDGIHGADHSHYYHPRSESLAAMGDIASGHGERLAGDHLLAAHRQQPHLVTPDHVNIPGLGRVPIPHIDVPIPGAPTVIDPEWDRPPDSIVDNH